MKANWLRAAMTDDNLVAEFLLLLNRPGSRPPRRAKPSQSLPPLDWGIRQPRSKAAVSLKKEHESSWRRSPTTPLSWNASGFGSGATSPRDSCEESSRPLVVAARFKWGTWGPMLPVFRKLYEYASVRSAFGVSQLALVFLAGDGVVLVGGGVIQWIDLMGSYTTPIVVCHVASLFGDPGSATTDTTNSVSASKRSRRKRTFAELKEEESSLLKEREHLKKQLESLRLKLEEQRLFNERLKRIKLNLHAQSATAIEQLGPSSKNGEPEREAFTSESPKNVSRKMKCEEISTMHNDFCPVLNGPSIEQPSIFVLPDLNMVPGIVEMS
ncbi:hypothetical protein V2J09_013487 [Rumex salicifolius]